MAYALVLGVMVALLGVKAYTMFSLGRLEKDVHDLKADDHEVSGKISALDGTRTQLERENKDVLAELSKLDTQKNQLVVNIQKFGAVPVEEPSTRETQPESPLPANVSESADITEQAETERDADPVAGEAGASGTDAAVPAESNETTEETEAGDGPRLLIVDDNQELRDLLCEALGRLYDVDSAADGLEALHCILKQNQRYDVVLTDLNMPNIDGLTFINKVPEGTNIVIMSAYLDRPEFESASAHPSVFLAIKKPFKLGEVKDAVAALLAESRLDHEDESTVEPVVMAEHSEKQLHE
jgi:two-component system, cell cycle response regulator CpdR